MKNRMIIFLSLICSTAWTQQSDKLIQQGNEYYKKQEFDKAASAYSKSVEADPKNSIAKFNLANALYKQNKEDEAIKVFTDVSDNTGKRDIKAKAYYNKGVAFSGQKKLKESIDAYKNALRQNPEDKEARENLQKALLELKKKDPPKKEKEQNKKKKQEQQKQQQQSKMSPKEAEKRLQLLAQKEKEVQQRMQKEKSKTGGSQIKDW